MTFEKGDLVRVVKLNVTDGRHGINANMKAMIGEEFFIESASSGSSVHIRDEKNKTAWTFAVEDLKIVKDVDSILSESMPTEPIMFDPKDL
jgi:hypothetical protein